MIMEIRLGGDDVRDVEVGLSQPQYGDVLAVRKVGYWHFGIYVNEYRVIHFSAPHGNSIKNKKKASIRVTNLEKFQKDGKRLTIFIFGKKPGPPKERNPPRGIPYYASITMPWDYLIKQLVMMRRPHERYHLYSPEETVQRAESFVGKRGYQLPTNNCEHFAVWCKTGVADSYQVKKVLKVARLFIGEIPYAALRIILRA